MPSQISSRLYRCLFLLTVATLFLAPSSLVAARPSNKTVHKKKRATNAIKNRIRRNNRKKYTRSTTPHSIISIGFFGSVVAVGLFFFKEEIFGLPPSPEVMASFKETLRPESTQLLDNYRTIKLCSQALLQGDNGREEIPCVLHTYGGLFASKLLQQYIEAFHQLIKTGQYDEVDMKTYPLMPAFSTYYLFWDHPSRPDQPVATHSIKERSQAITAGQAPRFVHFALQQINTSSPASPHYQNHLHLIAVLLASPLQCPLGMKGKIVAELLQWCRQATTSKAWEQRIDLLNLSLQHNPSLLPIVDLYILLSKQEHPACITLATSLIVQYPKRLANHISSHTEKLSELPKKLVDNKGILLLRAKVIAIYNLSIKSLFKPKKPLELIQSLLTISETYPQYQFPVMPIIASLLFCQEPPKDPSDSLLRSHLQQLLSNINLKKNDDLKKATIQAIDILLRNNIPMLPELADDIYLALAKLKVVEFPYSLIPMAWLLIQKQHTNSAERQKAITKGIQHVLSLLKHKDPAIESCVLSSLEILFYPNVKPTLSREEVTTTWARLYPQIKSLDKIAKNPAILYLLTMLANYFPSYLDDEQIEEHFKCLITNYIKEETLQIKIRCCNALKQIIFYQQPIQNDIKGLPTYLITQSLQPKNSQLQYYNLMAILTILPHYADLFLREETIQLYDALLKQSCTKESSNNATSRQIISLLAQLIIHCSDHLSPDQISQYLTILSGSKDKQGYLHHEQTPEVKQVATQALISLLKSQNQWLSGFEPDEQEKIFPDELIGHTADLLSIQIADKEQTKSNPYVLLAQACLVTTFPKKALTTQRKKRCYIKHLNYYINESPPSQDDNLTKITIEAIDSLLRNNIPMLPELADNIYLALAKLKVVEFPYSLIPMARLLIQKQHTNSDERQKAITKGIQHALSLLKHKDPAIESNVIGSLEILFSPNVKPTLSREEVTTTWARLYPQIKSLDKIAKNPAILYLLTMLANYFPSYLDDEQIEEHFKCIITSYIKEETLQIKIRCCNALKQIIFYQQPIRNDIKGLPTYLITQSLQPKNSQLQCYNLMAIFIILPGYGDLFPREGTIQLYDALLKQSCTKGSSNTATSRQIISLLAQLIIYCSDHLSPDQISQYLTIVCGSKDKQGYLHHEQTPEVKQVATQALISLLNSQNQWLSGFEPDEQEKIFPIGHTADLLSIQIANKEQTKSNPYVLLAQACLVTTFPKKALTTQSKTRYYIRDLKYYISEKNKEDDPARRQSLLALQLLLKKMRFQNNEHYPTADTWWNIDESLISLCREKELREKNPLCLIVRSLILSKITMIRNIIATEEESSSDDDDEEEEEEEEMSPKLTNKMKKLALLHLMQVESPEVHLPIYYPNREDEITQDDEGLPIIPSLQKVLQKKASHIENSNLTESQLDEYKSESHAKDDGSLPIASSLQKGLQRRVSIVYIEKNADSNLIESQLDEYKKAFLQLYNKFHPEDDGGLEAFVDDQIQEAKKGQAIIQNAEGYEEWVKKLNLTTENELSSLESENESESASESSIDIFTVDNETYIDHCKLLQKLIKQHKETPLMPSIINALEILLVAPPIEKSHHKYPYDLVQELWETLYPLAKVQDPTTCNSNVLKTSPNILQVLALLIIQYPHDLQESTKKIHPMQCYGETLATLPNHFPLSDNSSIAQYRERAIFTLLIQPNMVLKVSFKNFDKHQMTSHEEDEEKDEEKEEQKENDSDDDESKESNSKSSIDHILLEIGNREVKFPQGLLLELYASYADPIAQFEEEMKKMDNKDKDPQFNISCETYQVFCSQRKFLLDKYGDFLPSLPEHQPLLGEEGRLAEEELLAGGSLNLSYINN